MQCPGAPRRASKESASLADASLAALKHAQFDRVKHVRDAVQEAINTFKGLKVNAAPTLDLLSPCSPLQMPGWQARDLGQLLTSGASVSAGGSLVPLQSYNEAGGMRLIPRLTVCRDLCSRCLQIAPVCSLS